MWTAELAERLAAEGPVGQATAGEVTGQPGSPGITVNCGHPGHVDTNIWKFGEDATWVQQLAAKMQKRTAISPEEGARTIIYLASSNEVDNITGGYFADCGQKRPAKKSLNPEIRKQLWDASAKMTGIK